MSKIMDIKGKTFNRLTVIKRVSSDKKGQSMWLCKCKCGRNKVIQGYLLKKGNTKSCGCLRKDIIPNNRLSLGISNMRRAIAYYKRSSKIRGLKYNLKEKQFEKLTQQDCYYCGIKPSNIIKRKWTNGEYIYNGLDRIDNTKGYIINNVVTCCKICNRRKGKATLQEYKDWIRRSYIKLFEEKNDTISK